MHPYYHEKLARQRHDELVAAADEYRLAREARAQRRLVVPSAERRGLLAWRFQWITGRLRPARPVRYVGPARWARQHLTLSQDPGRAERAEGAT